MDFGTIAAIGGSQLLSGMMGSSAAEDAASMQAGATNAATGEQRRQFDVTRSDTAPFRAGGTAAMDKIMSMMGMPSRSPIGKVRLSDGSIYSRDELDKIYRDDYIAKLSAQGYDASFVNDNAIQEAVDKRMAGAQPISTTTGPTDPFQVYGEGPLNKRFTIDDFWQDPVVKLSYQSGMDLGTKALRNAAPLTTGMDSGAALKELTKFGQDYAGSKSGESLNRFETEKGNVFNRLMAMVGGGQQAVNTSTAAGANAATNIGNLQTAGANAQGAARIAGSNAWSGGLSNLSNWWQQNQMLDKYMGGGAGNSRAATPLSNFAFNGMGVGGYQYG